MEKQSGTIAFKLKRKAERMNVPIISIKTNLLFMSFFCNIPKFMITSKVKI